ncbi:MAG: multidrug transporter [Bacilli bacterium]|nr:multidrug transporter [Bacilli bacterium]
MKKIINSIKTFNWRLWLVLATTLLIPALYKTLRIFFLGDLPSSSGVDIASQLAWVNIIYEVIEEAFILPLFYLLGKSFNNKKELANKTRTGLLISGGAYLLLSIIIISCAEPLCKFMASDPSTLTETVNYIRLETVASTISILSKFITVLLVTINKDKYMYILLVVQTVLSILLDTFLISKLPCSANMGVDGIAVSNIAVSIISVVSSFIMLKKEGINVFTKDKLDFKWLKEYGKIGLLSGLESFIRNLAYMLMVLRLVNTISEQGAYWVANNFIWTWLLLPATALYDVIKKETAENRKNVKDKFLGYIVISTLFTILWLITIPAWKPFIQYVLNSDAYETIFHIVLIQTGFYIAFIYNYLLDGIIYGRGKTYLMLIQTIVTNGTYYVIMFSLWKAGIFIPTLDGIALMFGGGMLLDFLATIATYIYMIKKDNY